ncbi:NAD(P)/FAD-dependent oxidoreductase [Thalassolituus sp. LLYu03]|uniref:NAD(P)/FAD-dependent oxidoreductase n=1 Tax=Thalassolituus sp. LLYu03 TaxID=3421656 RepID=UPI003D288521
MQSHTLIIGGGITGLACASYLQRSGKTRVTVLEAGELAAGTTSQAAALLTRARSDDNSAVLVDETHRILKQLEARFGALAIRGGCVHVACTAAEEERLQAYARQADALRQDVRWLNGAELAAALPWLALPVGAVGLLYADDGHADPYGFAHFYARAARADGAQLRTHTRVADFLCTPDHDTHDKQGGKRAVAGVITTEGETILADQIVLAAGPWSPVLARSVNLPLAMAPVRSHYWITDHLATVSARQPMAIVPSAKAYFRPEHSGLLFGVRDQQICVADPQDLPADIHAFRFAHDSDGWQALEEHWQSLLATCPALENTGLAHYLSGVSSYTPDGKPLLGQAPGFANVWLATGCSGAGIALSGGTGRLLSEMLLGEPLFADPAPYDPGRFPAADAFDPDFRVRCAKARSGKSTG